jgi:hypothetical protein
MAKPRASTAQRGYGHRHQQLRTHWQARIDAGEVITCWRPDCDNRITGTEWDLGHDDDDRRIYRGPECTHCNRSAAGKKSQRKPDPREQQSREW